MDTISDLVQYCAPELPGATSGFLQNKLRGAARQFCRETEAWTQELYEDQVADQASYDLTPEADAYVQRIIHVKTKTSSSDVFDNLSAVNPRTYELDSDGFGFTFYDSYETDYDITDGVEIKVALRPTSDADTFTGDLFNRYGEAIYALTKSNVMRIPKKSYTDISLAMYYKGVYNDIKNVAIREKYTKNKRLDMHVNQLGGIL